MYDDRRYKRNKGILNQINVRNNGPRTSGNTGDYIQLIGGIVSAIGDVIQAYGQGVSINEDRIEQLQQEQDQQQIQQQLEQLSQQVATTTRNRRVKKAARATGTIRTVATADRKNPRKL